jgi:predicted lactoylglutathione lyase
MATKIFVNLPVKDLNKSKEFFSQLGYSFNPQFTDEKAASMVISEDIYAMLLVEDFFKTFTTKEIVDAKKSVESIICLSVDSKPAVDELISKAIAAGGSTYNDPQDHGFMYQHGFQDPDGHIWEIVWMDPAAINQPQ